MVRLNRAPRVSQPPLCASQTPSVPDSLPANSLSPDAAAHKTCVLAITTLLERAERTGRPLSSRAHAAVERRCTALFDHARRPAPAVAFAATLKCNAVRLFRQRRYREADARYALAARFDPADPTLISNRATCMYNLQRYALCADMCNRCVSQFPTLLATHTLLFFKVMVRKARAEVELGEFDAARATYDALVVVRDVRRGGGCEAGVGEVLEEQRDVGRVIEDFKNHLEAKVKFESFSKQVHRGTTSQVSAEELVDDVDEGFGSEDDQPTVRAVHLSELCPHISERGVGACAHPIVHAHGSADLSGELTDEEEYDWSYFDDPAGASDDDLPSLTPASDVSPLAFSESDGLPPLAFPSDSCDSDGPSERDDSYLDLDDAYLGEGEDDVEVDGFWSDLAEDAEWEYGDDGADEDDYEYDEDFLENDEVDSYGDECVDGVYMTSEEGYIESFCGIPADAATREREYNGGSEPYRKQEFLNCERPEWESTLERRNPLISHNTVGSSQASLKGCGSDQESKFAPALQSQTAALLSGLECGNRDSERWRASFKTATAEKARKAAPNVEHTRSSSPKPRQSPSKLDVSVSALFKEKYLEAFSANAREDSKTLETAKDGTRSATVNCLRDLFGKSFPTHREIDFTRMFGQHEIFSRPGKRKKKSCSKNCGTCFAEKMWKARFVDTDSNMAAATIRSTEVTLNEGQGNSFGEMLWHSTGYYGSGCELAFDYPALVHGAAYICQLQAELAWRGDRMPLARDCQRAFIASIEHNCQSENDAVIVCRLYIYVRETVKLLAFFSGQAGRKEQHAVRLPRTAASVASDGKSSMETGRGASSKHQLLLKSRTSDVLRNHQKWATLGQVVAEEMQIYGSILSGLDRLLTKKFIKSHINVPSGGDSQERLLQCPEATAKNEWSLGGHLRSSILFCIIFERSRTLEQGAGEAADAEKLHDALTLYGLCIQGRPREPQLYLKRARLHATARNWTDSLSDVHKAISILTEPSRSDLGPRCSSSDCCLLQELRILEGHLVFQKSAESKHESVSCMTSAIESVETASDRKACAASLESEVNMKLAFVDKARHDPNERCKARPLLNNAGKATEILRRNPSLQTSVSASRAQDKQADNLSRANDETSKTSGMGGRNQGDVTQHSSDSDDEYENCLVGNPYAALVRVEADANSLASSSTTTRDQGPSRQRRRGLEPRLSQHLELPSAETSRPNRHSNIHPPPINADSGTNREPHIMTSSAEGGHKRQTRGNDYLSKIANASVAGKARKADLIPASEGKASPVPVGSSHTASASSDNAQRRQRPTFLGGPGREETAAELERVLVILGGEATEHVLYSRTDLSKWSITDVQGYLEFRFNGLGRFCRSLSWKFSVRQNRNGTTSILLKNEGGGGFASTNRRRRAASTSATPQTRQDSRPAEGLPNERTRGQGKAATFSSMLSNSPSIAGGDKKQQTGAQSSDLASTPKDEEMCGICYDNVPDVRIIPCKHEWCESCITANISRERYECPMCMGKVHHLERLANDLD